MPTPILAAVPVLTPAEQLARKIARIESLRAENAADYRPSFVALLERCEPRETVGWREAA